jgi:arsenical pump membrane protein
MPIACRSQRSSAGRSCTAPRTSTARPKPALNSIVAAIGRGTDVYLFLIGMMGLAGYAQRTGIFGWVADRAVRIAGTSRLRLFALVYGAGIVTTAFFSNDATIVVLTPAVIDALRRFDASPVPYVVACALIANAASFLLPISNPSNLLVFAGRIPSLGAWLALFIVPSIVAIAVTYAIVWWFYRSDLAGAGAHVTRDAVHAPDPLAIAVLAASAAVIVATSALAGPLGAVTFACAAVALAITIVRDAPGALKIVREISWRVIVLTALLFVVVTALDDRGGFAFSRSVLTTAANYGAPWASLATGFATALASNAINNLPVGLNLGETLPAMHASTQTATAALIGVNLGPNATVNGSLATILWLTILARNGIRMSWLGFAGIGLLTTIPALAFALIAAAFH